LKPTPATPSPRDSRPCDGQAVVEFVIGIVAVLALTGFLVQWTQLTRAHRDTMTEARRQAGRLALSGILVPANPDYIRSWYPGEDASTYSRDDYHRAGHQGEFRGVFTAPIAPSSPEATVMGRVAHNPVRDLANAGTPVNVFGLFSRRAADDVPLLPVVRHLLYRDESIFLESEVWMTANEGIY
jgi:hypothetical protein